MADIYQYLTQDLYTTATPATGDSSASGSTAQAASTSSETPSESIVSGEVDGNISMIGGFIQSKNFVTGSAGWRINSDGSVEFASGNFRGDITGATGTFSGTVNVGSLNIPDSTTASSMHVDSNGNAWWGANVASGYTGANAYILATGAAVFKNVSIGGTTIQYVITNSGIFSYGDGSDGSVTLDGSTAVTGMSRSGSTYTMTRDVYFVNITINVGITLNTNSYRPFAQGTATINGTIDLSGGNGGKGGTGTQGFNPGIAGTAGSSPSNGYLSGSPAPGTGGQGTGGQGPGVAGQNGTNVTNSLGSIGSTGGTGGYGHGAGTVGGSPGTWATANVALKVGIQLAELLDVTSTGSKIKYGNSSGAGGGSGGGGGNEQSSGGGGGGGGGTGGIIAIYARNIVIGATGLISANGGNGGAGGDISSNQSPSTHTVGGGGGGGNGGIIILVYNSFTNSGSITVTAGTGGAIGTVLSGPGTTTNATAGTNGSAGTIYQFQLSL